MSQGCLNTSAVEFFFNKIEEREKDSRKLGKQIEKMILPMIKLIGSTIEQSHFISMLAKRTGIKEEILWEDLKKIKRADVSPRSDLGDSKRSDLGPKEAPTRSQREQIEERLAEIKLWQKELPASIPEILVLEKEESELLGNLSGLLLRDKLNQLLSELSRAEMSKNSKLITRLTMMIQKVHRQMRALEEKKKIL